MANPFELLAVEPRFDIDFGALEARHRELSSTLHPDRHARASALERRRALSRAIEVNEALRILKDPVRRAEALLERHGFTVSENDAASAPDFLMEVLELREELAAAQRSRDPASVKRQLETFAARQATLEEQLRRAFEELRGLPSSAQERELVQRRIAGDLGELRFFRRLIAEAHAILDDLD